MRVGGGEGGVIEFWLCGSGGGEVVVRLFLFVVMKG